MAANLESVSAKYPQIKACSKWRDIASIYEKENPKLGYYMLYLIATTMNKFYATLNPKPEDLQQVLGTLVKVLQHKKQTTNAHAEEDKDEMSVFVVEHFAQCDELIRSGNADPSSIKQALNVS